MSDLLFDVPWWLVGLLLIVGMSVFVSGNRRQNPRIRESGAGLILLAVIWGAVSYLVDTDKEKCQKQSKQFVQSVVAQDWVTFDNLLDTDVAFRFSGSPWSIVGKDTLDHALRTDIHQIGVESARVSGIDAKQELGTVTVHLSVWSTQKSTMDQPLNSEWEFDWQKQADKWLLHEVRALRVANLSSEQIRASLPVR
jgi:hypothetical protein